MAPSASVTSILNSVAQFAWPLIAVVVVFLIWPELRRVLKSRAFTIKLGNFELSAQDANDQLVRQVNDLQMRLVRLEGHDSSQPAAAPPAAAPETMRSEGNGVGTQFQARHGERDIVWVDDNPSGNAFEIQAFESSGYSVAVATSTADGIQAYESMRPRVVITDLGREEPSGYNRDAGLALIRMLRNHDPRIPVIVYTSMRSVADRASELERAGAFAVTASPSELLREVENALAHTER